MSKKPLIVGVGGVASNVGKTTLMCELLRGLPDWEAIKTTRGHYRSCGKDASTCCVSHLLSDRPLIFSGREQTYQGQKDTGRYWDAGAANVHWVVSTTQQLESGIKEALARVASDGVLIEGNSFTEYVPVDYFIMVADDTQPMKRSAKAALMHASAIFNSRAETDAVRFSQDRGDLAAYSPRDIPLILAQIQELFPPY